MEMQREFEKSLEIAHALFDPNYPLRTQVFSFGFYKGRALAVGRNLPKTHTLNIRNPLIFRDSGKIHYTKNSCSELGLFIKLRNLTNIKYNKITIVNVRLNRHQQVALSKPCRSCNNLLAFVQPRAIYYTDNCGKFQSYTVKF